MSYREQSVSHGDIGYHPSNEELLQSYADRLKSIQSQLRQNFTDHFKWWEHRQPKPCRICNILDMLDYCIDSLVNVPNADKKGVWKYKLDLKFDTIDVHRIRKP